MEDLSVVIPIYNENHDIVKKLRHELIDLGIEVIIVDDGSEFPYPDAIKHGVNFGYGAALLTGIKNSSREYVITMDGDFQHRVQDVINIYNVWKMLGDVDLLIGSRRLKYEKWYRVLGRKFLNFIASIISLIYLQDLNSGMRMFKKSIVLGYAPILCKTFSFTTSLTMSMLCDGYKVETFPIKVSERKHGKSKVKVIRDGFITLFYILWIGIAIRTRGIRAIWRKIFHVASS